MKSSALVARAKIMVRADLALWIRTHCLLAALMITTPCFAEDETKQALFMWGTHQLGMTIGYGHGVSFAGSGFYEGHQVRELILLPHYQIDITRPPVSQRWHRGRLSFRAETTVIVNFEPRLGVAAGLGLLLRYNFLAMGRVVPYVEGGAGFLWLDLEIRDQVDGFAFQPQGGVGLLYRLSPRTSFELGTRFHHISNAYTREPNGGIDSVQILLGYTHHFE